MSKPDFVWPALASAGSDEQDLATRRAQAVDEGYAAGHAQGLAAAREELAAHYQRLAQAVDELERQSTWLLRSDANSLHNVVGQILASILDVELSVNQKIYRNFIELGVQSLAGPPQQLHMNQATFARLSELAVDCANCSLEVDDALPDGSLRMATADSIIAFDPKAELDQLLSASAYEVEQEATSEAAVMGLTHNSGEQPADENS
ncbi:MAG: hypothetical protein NXH85_12710 [Pseudomonadaceae bacterium]|nr:hypothetical protein [Pseudomonadaceae bacterium]